MYYYLRHYSNFISCKILALLFILLIDIGYSQPNWFIHPEGDDIKGDGSEGHPWQTINTALAHITNGVGGTINVMTGTINYSQRVEITKSGNSINPLIIKAHGAIPTFLGSSTIIFPSGPTYEGVFEFDTGIQYVQIEGIRILDVTAHINLMGIIVRGNNNKISNCVLENMKRSGIVVHGSYNLIDKNFVSNIIGSDDYNKRGNNISVESAPGVIAEYNVIQNNVLLQNPTHNGVNIFPDTQDENQTPMNGNKIINNYIDGTGGGIYTRFQINLEIVGNVIVNSFIDDPRWDTNGGGITFDFNHNFSFTPPFSAGTVKIYNNTLYNNEKYGLQNYTFNILKIYNNIFENTNSAGYILFSFLPEVISTSNKIDFNCYFGGGFWEWGRLLPPAPHVYYYSFSVWKSESHKDQFSLNEDPLLELSGDYPYSIQLHSPVKNYGKPFDEVTTDIRNILRPYWFKGVDLGAYELPEAQLRCGVNNYQGTQFNINIEALGTFWKKEGSSWNITQDQDIANSSYLINQQISDKELWDGFHYKWFRNDTDEEPMGHALYMVSAQGKFFYLDLRDAATGYNPNLYIRFDDALNQKKFQYFDGIDFDNDINSGDVLRVWEINQGYPTTAYLNSYWNNTLVCVNQNSHPRLFWGPLQLGSSIVKYYVNKSGHAWGSPPATFTRFDSTSNSSYEYIDFDEVIGSGQSAVSYRISAWLGPPSGEGLYEESDPSNYITFRLSWAQKLSINEKNQSLSYSLSQNYPNPFNPSTKISFSVPEPEKVSIVLYDILGKEVKFLVNQSYEPGSYDVYFNAAGLASGTYIYKFTAGNYTNTKKMQIIK